MKLFPDEYTGRFEDYDFEKAYKSGRRLVLFDIDNTLVPHGAPADEHTVRVAERLKSMGFRLAAVSNNDEARVKPFCDKLGIPYVFKAGKPRSFGYLKALDDAGLRKDEALFFGDQIFTDIMGAKRAGIRSVLVKPVDRRTDEIQIKIKRILEKPVIKAFFKRKNLAIKDYFI